MNAEVSNSVLVDAVLSRICHDLIGSFGTAQMAMESEELSKINSEEITIAKDCINQAIAKLEIFKVIFKNQIISEKSTQIIQNFILSRNLDCTINKSIATPALIFFFVQKMISSSSVKFEMNQIMLKKFFLTQEEIDILSGKALSITAGTILAYLAFLQFRDLHKLSIEKQEENNWIIQIHNLT